MPNLDAYLRKKRGAQSELARSLGLSPGTLSSIRTGDRRASPSLAKRIEAATNGEVSAAGLLGLEEATAHFERHAKATCLGDGRWAVVVAADGSATLSPEMIRALGFAINDRLVFEVHGDEVRMTSVAKAMKKAQAEFNRLVPPGVDVVGDFLADRRAEAARE